jgi:hypothetical protein
VNEAAKEDYVALKRGLSESAKRASESGWIVSIGGGPKGAPVVKEEDESTAEDEPRNG